MIFCFFLKVFKDEPYLNKMFIKKFEDLKVSTRTIIASANVNMNIDMIFKQIPLSKHIFLFHGQKYSVFIDTMHYKNCIREQHLKDIVNNMGHQKSFRNALNVVMFLDDFKKINFKVSKNGKFQITGCKNLEHAKISVYTFLELIGKYYPEAIQTHENFIEVSFEIVMTNVDCGMGYNINRQSLDKIINSSTPYHSLLETSFGYTGVNIKFPVEKDWFHMNIPTVGWELNKPETLRFNQTPLSQVSPTKKIKKKYNTFLVFHSGQFIMSGMREDTMKDDYYRFIDILKSHENKIKEILDT